MITRIINDIEYIYFRDSMKLMVRHPNTDIPASFDMDDLQTFLKIVSDELRKELIDDAMSTL